MNYIRASYPWTLETLFQDSLASRFRNHCGVLQKMYQVNQKCYVLCSLV